VERRETNIHLPESIEKKQFEMVRSPAKLINGLVKRGRKRLASVFCA
jgi:hypothetical protein